VDQEVVELEIILQQQLQEQLIQAEVVEDKVTMEDQAEPAVRES
jgi:hypothetical protein